MKITRFLIVLSHLEDKVKRKTAVRKKKKKKACNNLRKMFMVGRQRQTI